jgi:uncharacterized Zn-finger protein
MKSTTAHKHVVSVYKIKKGDLPVSCPPKGDDVSSLHPRVYLTLNKEGHTKCPYCGAEYVLED